MTLDTYTIRIEELESLQWEIGEKIRALKAKAGIADDDFETKLDAAESVFKELILDRANYEDDVSLWMIFATLRDLQDDVFTNLRG